MRKGYIINNATIINENRRFTGYVVIKGQFIELVGEGTFNNREDYKGYEEIDANGKYLIPGAIDDQVHFREPGLTPKGDLYSEPKAAVAGGITSFMEMPNTYPPAVTQNLLADKYLIAEEKSLANYSFYLGTTSDNLDQLLKTDPTQVCGIKIFMGSSTGNMLVDDSAVLSDIFREVKMLIAVHCEDDNIIRSNAEKAKAEFGENIPMRLHPEIRSAEACYASSSKAVELAAKYNTRLHILHISTERELSLFRNDIPLSEKRITAEACVHHLWFSDEDYHSRGSFIKWNPAVKSVRDRDAIREGVINGKIDVLATDHAPHTLLEKENPYFSCPSGGPLVQHALPALFELAAQGVFTPELIVSKYCHAVADMFSINKRGYIREGYFADLVIIDPDKSSRVERNLLYYKCGWSPFEGLKFSSTVEKTFVNGHLVYNDGVFDESRRGMRLTFNR
ncbi:MAG: dihydroorotase [Bacteroidetes bacterium]|nr:dihydroorotase [Bacteroidota bacterium]